MTNGREGNKRGEGQGGWGVKGRARMVKIMEMGGYMGYWEEKHEEEEREKRMKRRGEVKRGKGIM